MNHSKGGYIVRRDGVIVVDGREIGFAARVDGGIGARIAEWRAEVGDPSNPEGAIPYRVGYASTRRRAIAIAMGDE